MGSSRHVVRQPQRKLRPQNDKSEHHEHGQMERDGAEDDFAELAVPDALNHEQVDADRRRNLPELDEQDEDDAEQDGIDAVILQHRKDQRHRDNDHAEAFDQAAKHRVENEQRQEEFQPAEIKPDDECGYLLAYSRKADGVGKHIGGEDDKQDVSGKFDGTAHRFDGACRLKVAERRAENEGKNAADGRAFGGRHQTEID